MESQIKFGFVAILAFMLVLCIALISGIWLNIKEVAKLESKVERLEAEVKTNSISQFLSQLPIQATGYQGGNAEEEIPGQQRKVQEDDPWEPLRVMILQVVQGQLQAHLNCFTGYKGKEGVKEEQEQQETSGVEGKLGEKGDMGTRGPVRKDNLRKRGISGHLNYPGYPGYQGPEREVRDQDKKRSEEMCVQLKVLSLLRPDIKEAVKREVDLCLNTNEPNNNTLRYKRQGANPFQGPPGPPGFPGPRGRRGQKGEMGEEGMTGQLGEKGEKGDLGTVGEKGKKGDIGPIGPAGPKGAMGQPGQKGNQGETGPIGEKGEKGDTGKQGAVGEKKPEKGQHGLLT